MSIAIQNAQVYTDLQSLDRVRYSADENSAETLRYVAEQFEAIFLQIMLKSAHSGSDNDDLLGGGEQKEFYQDWYDKQLSINLASGKGIGIADMLLKQLRLQGYNNENVKELAEENISDVKNNTLINQNQKIFTSKEKVSLNFDTPQDFVNHLLPMAKAAAKKIGVAPEVLIAQAALETGWGKKVAQSNSGESSHNLFNIKADHRWDGEKVSVSTLEFYQGIPQREKANFRAYESYQASFNDYVEFIRTSPRYQMAVNVASDSKAYTQELARAGYATDPEYSNKIMSIVDSAELSFKETPVKL